MKNELFSPECGAFRGLIQAHSDLGSLSSERVNALVSFYRMVLQENEVQNLTRLLSPQDFFDGHLLDAWELEKAGFLEAPALDLGTGVGSPGLFHALLRDFQWVLCDSEVQKVAFLSRAVDALGIGSRVSAVNMRGEDYLANHPAGVVTSKAVGSVEKIYGWIGRCSTWNSLILFKGPKWDEEWEGFQRSKFRSKLRIGAIHSYFSGSEGPEQRQRKIVQLLRT